MQISSFSFLDVYGLKAMTHVKWQPGNTNSGERLSTVDLLIRVTCFAKKGK
jgi:hypothetical protein